MLRHETIPAEIGVKLAATTVSAPQVSDSAGAAQLRVTPEELAQALAALDARRAQATHDARQTIAIGDALIELNVEATPEEVAAEVEAARAAHLKRQNGLNQPFRTKADLPAQVIIGTAGALCAILSIFAARTFSSHPPPLSPTVVVQAPAPRRLTMDQILVDQKSKNGVVTIKTLAEVGDKKAVSVKSGDLIRATDLTLGDNTEASPLLERAARWNVVKRDGVPYVLGYLPAPLSPGALRLGNVTIANRPKTNYGHPFGPTPTPVFIRMDKIVGIVDNKYTVGPDNSSYSVNDGNWERITFRTFPADALYDAPAAQP